MMAVVAVSGSTTKLETSVPLATVLVLFVYSVSVPIVPVLPTMTLLGMKGALR